MSGHPVNSPLNAIIRSVKRSIISHRKFYIFQSENENPSYSYTIYIHNRDTPDGYSWYIELYNCTLNKVNLNLYSKLL